MRTTREASASRRLKLVTTSRPAELIFAGASGKNTNHVELFTPVQIGTG